MFSLCQLINNYDETGLLNEQASPQGFIDEHLFVTRAGDLGAVLEVRWVDFECLDNNVFNHTNFQAPTNNFTFGGRLGFAISPQCRDRREEGVQSFPPVGRSSHGNTPWNAARQ
jgi:hypothetical protein